MDLDIYTTEMSKSVWDKAFFMDKIPGVKCVIDFGCADGAMIRYLSSLFPDTMFIGYDINIDLIARARSTPPFNANVLYFTNIDSLINFVFHHDYKEKEICVNFSSVLHEVFSSTGGIEVIQTLIGKLEPRYITIRDMYCDEKLPFLNGIQNEIVDKIVHNGGSEAFEAAQRFARKFGLIENWRDMTHLLMKLQWIDNGFDDELKEDYYSWKIDDFINLLGNQYIPAFDCRYQLPYLAEKWKNEYGFYNPDIHTHAQFILRRDD